MRVDRETLVTRLPDCHLSLEIYVCQRLLAGGGSDMGIHGRNSLAFRRQHHSVSAAKICLDCKPWTAPLESSRRLLCREASRSYISPNPIGHRRPDSSISLLLPNSGPFWPHFQVRSGLRSVMKLPDFVEFPPWQKRQNSAGAEAILQLTTDLTSVLRVRLRVRVRRRFDGSNQIRRGGVATSKPKSIEFGWDGG